MNGNPGKAAGTALREAREARGLSIRAAARLAEQWLQQHAQDAKFSEALWRNMEQGERTVTAGIRVPANPRPRNIHAAAAAVGLDPAGLLRAYGHEPPVSPPPPRPRFADPALQRVYDAAEGLDESDRLNLVALAEAMRARQKDA